MRALILAAGFGTRLRPLTNHIPKCLVDINGRPLLDYWLELLNVAEIENILINLHYLPELVKDYILSSKYSSRITMTMEESLLGTGGTLLKNSNFFKEDPILMIHADNLSFFNIQSLINKFNSREKHIVITMMTFTSSNPEQCGIVELDKDGIVTAFYEKVKNPPGNLANGAVYIIEPKVIDYMKSLNKKNIDFSNEVIPHFVGKINTFHNLKYHRDIGTIESLARARLDINLLCKNEKYK